MNVIIRHEERRHRISIFWRRRLRSSIFELLVWRIAAFKSELVLRLLQSTCNCVKCGMFTFSWHALYLSLFIYVDVTLGFSPERNNII